jgi:YVTN family beta-propeller protein
MRKRTLLLFVLVVVYVTVAASSRGLANQFRGFVYPPPGHKALSRAAMFGTLIRPLPPESTLHLVLVLRTQHDRDLDNLIDLQSDPRSPLYHRWITPSQYAAYFGAPPQTVDRTVIALRSRGFQHVVVPLNRRFIYASAQAGIVERTFSTPLDLRFDGRRYFVANRHEPTIPAFLDAVRSVIGLDSFQVVRPSLVVAESRSSNAGLPHPGVPRPIPQATVIRGQFAFGPSDLYKAYDFQPLFSAGFTGTNQTVAIVLVRQPLQSDLDGFSTQFGLPATALHEIFLTGACPNPCPQATTKDDARESAADSEWIHAAAPQATIDSVSVGDVLIASLLIGFEYVVDTLGNAVKTVSVSYGSCEPLTVPDTATAEAALIEQGTAEGQTWFTAAGDFGSDGCSMADDNHATVRVPAAVPYVVAVGGTTMNPPLSLGNVQGYGPEMVWNDSPCKSTPVGSGATGGGASELFGKPKWQQGRTPSDGVRDVPDVALYSDPYITSTKAAPENCSEVAGYWINVENVWDRSGGTSIASPIWAGLVADIAQKAGHSLGLISPSLYTLESSAAFHQITTGNNFFNGIKTCCTAAAGYNQAKGLGTVDAYQLASMLTVSPLPTPRATTFPLPVPHPTKTPSTFPTARAIILDLGNGGESPNPNAGDIDIFDASVPGQGTLLKTEPNVTSPVDVAYNSTGLIAYILQFNGKIDTVSLPSNAFMRNVFSLGQTHTVALAIKGTNAYVVDQVADKVLVQPLGKPTASPRPIPVGLDPVSVIANPTLPNTYVANAGSNTVSIIDTTTNKLVQTLPVGPVPMGLAISPNGKTLLVANRGAGSVSIVNVSVSPAVVSDTVFVGGIPMSIAVNAQGSIAYVANQFCPLSASLCSPDGHVRNGTVELVTLTGTPIVQCCIVVGPTPVAVSFEPTGRYLWVINSGGHGFSIVDTQTNLVVQTNTGLLETPISSGSFVHAVP